MANNFRQSAETSPLGRSYQWTKRRLGLSQGLESKVDPTESQHSGTGVRGNFSRLFSKLKPKRKTSVMLKNLKFISGFGVQELEVDSENRIP
jgi:hypothetical protein